MEKLKVTKNRRYGMRLINMWLTEAELESLKESLKDEKYSQNIVDILYEVNNRGDLNG